MNATPFSQGRSMQLGRSMQTQSHRHAFSNHNARAQPLTPLAKRPQQRERRCTPQCVAQQQVETAVADHAAAASTSGTTPAQELKEAVLYTSFKAHDAAITSLAVLRDDPGFKQIVTASLDKSLAVWTLEGGDLNGPQLQCSRMEVAGGPVFSLQRGIKSKVTDVNDKPREPVLFCGLASKEISALRPDTLTFSQQMRMNGHTGWVRSLASSGKYLFSCGCNHLHQWDQAYAVPKEVRSMSLFTGDILALAATDKAVFTAGADGSLRRWALGKLGELSEAEVRDKAHEGRITALAVSGSLLFSAGYDGDIKAWDVSNLQLVMEVKAAHAGERVRALVMGPLPPSSKSSSPAASAAPSPTPAPPPADRCFEQQPEQQQQLLPPEQPVAQQEQEQQPEGGVLSQAVEPLASPASAAADASLEEYDVTPEPPAAVAAAADGSLEEYDVKPDPPVATEAAPAAAADGSLEEYDVTPDLAAPTEAAAEATAAAAADASLEEYDVVPDPPAPTAAAAADGSLEEYDVVPDPPVATEAAAPADGSLEEFDVTPDTPAAAAAAALEPATAAEQPPSPEPAAASAPAAIVAAAAVDATPSPEPTPAATPASSNTSSPASSRPASPSLGAVLYSAGDDGLVRRWDAHLLAPVGEPLQVHHSAVKALAVGDKELLVSGDAAGEVALWLL